MRIILNRLKRVLLLLLLMVVMGVVIAVYLIWQATQPPALPEFYHLPDVALYQEQPLGSVIRYEPITYNPYNDAEAWRILYLSQDMNDQPIIISALVIVPTVPTSKPRPVIAWAHGTVGILPECGVSHTHDPYRQTPAIQVMIDEGFIIVAPDYQGISTGKIHPYLVGTSQAYAVLDSVRAVHDLGLNATQDFVVWGASQGGHASLWTAQLAKSYAPELNLIASAASAPAINLERILQDNLDQVAGGVFIAEVLYAWDAVYAEADLDQLIRPDKRQQFERIAKTCISTPLAFLTVGGLMTPRDYLSTDPFQIETWANLLEQNTPTDPIDVPILMTHGTSDDLIAIEQSETEAKRRCEAGEDVTFIRLAGVGHDARDESSALTIAWLQDRFAGLNTSPTCGREA